jgi:hypothetical protein
MKPLLITFIFLLASQAYAQQLVSTSGDHYINEEANAQISWSLGETIIETQIKPDGILTQGFHQTHLIYVSVPHPPLLMEAIKIYPVPVSDYLTIELAAALHDPDMIITDITGRILLSNKLSQGKNKIQLSHLASGSYYIQILSDNKPIFNDKLIKR